MLKRLKYSLDYKFSFLKTYLSPFKPLQLKWYFGEIKIGTPYFLPRRIKDNKFVRKYFGFDFVGLGWKTKWEPDDYRFEYSPIWSFVFFKWQIALIFIAPELNHYWECFLYYKYETDKSKSINERIEDARKGFPCVWINQNKGVKIKIDYWDKILKEKYINNE